MMQAEKALRDAGWEEVALSEVRAGDELYDLKRYEVYTARVDGKLTSIGRALRAPRTEPEYEPGTVARVRDSDGRHHIAMMKVWGFWGTADGSLHRDNVEVIRVLAGPDGSTLGTERRNERE